MSKSQFPNPYHPSEDELQKYLHTWNTLQNYRAHDLALADLFQGPQNPYALNSDIDKVIIKVSALNDFYSTNLYRVHDVANKILAINDFDQRLANGDISLVEDLRRLVYRAYTLDGKTPERNEEGAIVNASWKDMERDIYSFATKYCSHHQPEKFPIYDRYVDDVLTHLKKQYPGVFTFLDFVQNSKVPLHKRKKGTLKDYPVFVKQIDILRDRFGLKNYTYKDIDRYLWQLGKRYFAPYPDSVNGPIVYG